jgi:hypothetical protein
VNDDDLLQALGELARERERDAMGRPDLWTRLANGDLSAGELGDLEARAASDPPLALSLRAYRPLSDEARERIVDALGASLSKPGSPPADSAPPAGSAPPGASSPPPVSKVVSLDARRRLVRTASPVVAAVVALAALWAIVVRPPAEPAFEPLPAYEIVARGGLKDTRGTEDSAPAKPLRLSPQSTLDLTLRPATKVEGQLAAHAFVVQNGDVRPISAAIEIAPTGALRLRGVAGEMLSGARGPAELRVVVGRAEAIGAADGPRQKAAAPEGRGRGWQTLRYAIEVVEAP